MDYGTIIVAAIALVGTIFGSWITGNKTTALILYRIETLEKKVEKHNSVVERTYKIETDIAEVKVRVDETRADVNRVMSKQ